MAGRADRAINMALRVLGIGEVERDFKRVGQAGEKGFAQVQKGANGAAREVSDYTARLKRAVAEAKRMADQVPELNRGTPLSRRNRNDFVLGAVKGEQARILQGLPDTTSQLERAAIAADGFGASATRAGALGAAAGAAIAGMGVLVRSSLDAFSDHEKALAAFNAAIALAGNRSSASADQIAATAERIVQATGQTEAAVLKAAQVLASVPGITQEGLAAALDASARLADSLGTDVPEQAQQAARVLTALAGRDMAALVKATEGLDDRLRATILTLAETGKTAEAQQAYLAGLSAAAGDGPGGLTSATSKLEKSWIALKEALAADIAGPAASAMDWLSGKLRGFQQDVETTRFSWNQFAKDAAGFAWSPLGSAALRDGRPFGRVAAPRTNLGARSHFTRSSGNVPDTAARATVRDFEERYGSGAPRRRGGNRGGSGRSGASEAERLQREAERAREAADRIAEANRDVVGSYAQRLADVSAKIGLEGAALEAVERQQEIEAAARRLNTELLEKEVEARRAAAAAAKQPFDQARATLDAARAVGEQASEVRRLAGELIDAERALDLFNKRQAEAKAILEQTRTPFEKIGDEVARLVDKLNAGDISADTFNRRMEVLAESVADLRHETDKAALAWEGFGQDVGRTFSDIILNGGSARDILQQLIRLPLERLLEQNVTNPIADLVDGLSGNNRDQEVAKARAQLPFAADGVGALGQQAYATARALASIQASLGVPVQELAGTTDQANQALGGLIPLTGQFGGALGQVIAMLAAQGGGGGGGFLGTVLGLAGAFAGGGISAARVASLTPSAAGAIAANPSLFAAGTERVPVGRPFYVGENGKELMELTREGNLRVHGEARTRRFLSEGGGVTIIQNNHIPERADPRRTASGIARATQSSIARVHRKGLASAGSK